MEREERYVVIKLSDIEKALELGHITQSNYTTVWNISYPNCGIVEHNVEKRISKPLW
uniref:Uncharacterized protein n=1 Tax=Salmonella phage PMBT36 TaxID=3229746 RepID=A0AB39C0L5_9CAUD